LHLKSPPFHGRLQSVMHPHEWSPSGARIIPPYGKTSRRFSCAHRSNASCRERRSFSFVPPFSTREKGAAAGPPHCETTSMLPHPLQRLRRSLQVRVKMHRRLKLAPRRIAIALLLLDQSQLPVSLGER